MTESVVLPETFEVQSGKVDSKWAEFGLHQVDIKLRDRETGYKLIVRDGEPLAITSKGYVLIPNEVALEAADAAAQRLGAKPFTDFSGPWFAKPENHVMMNFEKTRMSALYAFDEPVEIAPGDKIHVGFSVRNGIDGGAAFGTGSWTFRHACANMFLMARLGIGRGMGFDDREVMSSLYQIHYGKPAELMATVDELVTVLEKVVQSGFQVVARLRNMTETKLTIEKAAKIQALPVKYLEKLSGFEVSKKAGKKAEVQFLGGDVTEYQVWNDLTQLLTHDSKGGWDTKMTQYATVQQIFFGAE
jgi:hypothetical protein